MMCKLNMPKHNTNGLLVTFCGLDGCGKTTLINMLAKEPIVQKHSVMLTKQPTNFVRDSDIFRTYMDCPDHSEFDYRSLSLLAAGDRVQHVSKVILPALQKEKIVISDRYFYSCLANLHARGFEDDQWIYEIAQSIVMPDIAFFLDIPVETAIARVRSRPDEKSKYIDMDLQYKLREKYLEICEANHGIVVSTARSPEETYQQILTEINKVMEGNMNIKEKVIDIVKDLCGAESIDLGDFLQEDLGIDSLGLVTLLIQLEDDFQIELKESDMDPFSFKSVLDVVVLVERYCEESTPQES